MTIRIASYNLWNGSKDTYFRFVDFIKEQQIGVLCLQEINNWQDDNFAKLNDFIDRAGFTDYEYGNSNTEFKLATLSTLPIISKTVHQEGFWHCVVEVHVRIGATELVILNVHLDPWKEDPRVKEIERLLNRVDTTKPTIITGDFNSISRQDNYPPEFLADLQQRQFYKFGQEALDFRVTDYLANAGFVDVAAQRGQFDITAPTPYGTADKKEPVSVTEAPARVDYAFVSSGLLPMVQDFTVVKNNETDKISDHYPLILTLDIPEAASTPGPETAREAPQPKSKPTPDAPAEGELVIKH